MNGQDLTPDALGRMAEEEFDAAVLAHVVDPARTQAELLVFRDSLIVERTFEAVQRLLLSMRDELESAPNARRRALRAFIDALMLERSVLRPLAGHARDARLRASGERARRSPRARAMAALWEENMRADVPRGRGRALERAERAADAARAQREPVSTDRGGQDAAGPGQGG